MNLYVILGFLVALGGTAAWGAWERGEAIRHGVTAQAAQDALRTERDTNAQLRADIQRSNEAVTALATRVADQQQATTVIRREINAAPASNACLSSPVTAAYLRGLRAANPVRPAAGTAAGPRGSLESVQGGTAAARDLRIGR